MEEIVLIAKKVKYIFSFKFRLPLSKSKTIIEKEKRSPNKCKTDRFATGNGNTEALNHSQIKFKPRQSESFCAEFMCLYSRLENVEPTGNGPDTVKLFFY